MADLTKTDLTYQDFIRLRANALAQLHAAQNSLERAQDPQYVPLPQSALTFLEKLVTAAELNLASVLDQWVRSKYNIGN